MSEANRNPTTPPPSRRTLLTGAVSALAATAVLAVPAVAISNTVEPDPAAVLGEQCRHALKRLHRSWAAIDHAESAIRKRGEEVLLRPSITVGNHWCCSVEEIRAASQEAGTDADLLVAEFRRRKGAYHRWRHAVGLAPLDREAKEAGRQEGKIMARLAKTPANTVRGIAAKLYAIRDDFSDGRTNFSDAILRSALRDAERLGEAVRS